MLEEVCKITEDGVVLWNEPLLVDYLEKCSFRRIKVNGVVRLFQTNTLVPYDYELLKWYLMCSLNIGSEYQKVRRVLQKNNICFSPKIMDALKEELPDEEYENYSVFYDEGGYMYVSEDDQEYEPC